MTEYKKYYDKKRKEYICPHEDGCNSRLRKPYTSQSINYFKRHMEKEGEQREKKEIRQKEKKEKKEIKIKKKREYPNSYGEKKSTEVKERAFHWDPDKENTSNFFVTINSNRRVSYPLKEEDKKYWIKFKEAIKSVLDNEKLYNEIFRFDPRLPEEKQLFNDKNIDLNKSEVSWVASIGRNNPEIHCHILMLIKHKTWLNLDPKKLAELIQEKMDSPTKFKMDIKIVRDSEIENMRKYMKYDNLEYTIKKYGLE